MERRDCTRQDDTACKYSGFAIGVWQKRLLGADGLDSNSYRTSSQESHRYFVWATRQIIHLIQAHNPAVWIFWQCIFTIVARVRFTKVYVQAKRSVFSTVAMLTTYNNAISLMPYFGSSNNPMYITLATLFTPIAVLLLPDSPRVDKQAAS